MVSQVLVVLNVHGVTAVANVLVTQNVLVANEKTAEIEQHW